MSHEPAGQQDPTAGHFDAHEQCPDALRSAWKATARLTPNETLSAPHILDPRLPPEIERLILVSAYYDDVLNAKKYLLVARRVKDW